MSKGKFEHNGEGNRKFCSKKSLSLVLACTLLLVGIVSGTLAWLTTKTASVENVFTTSDIAIKLVEDEKEFKMIPGWTIDKSPRITVEKDSEDCWLFVEVTESANLALSDYIKYAVNTSQATVVDNVTHGGWTQGTGNAEGGNGIPTNVYFRKVTNISTDQVFAVLGGGTYTFGTDNYKWENDEVLTKPEVTKEMMGAVTAGESGNQPKLSFTAYASQLKKNNNTEFTAAQAWSNLNSIATPD